MGIFHLFWFIFLGEVGGGGGLVFCCGCFFAVGAFFGGAPVSDLPAPPPPPPPRLFVLQIILTLYRSFKPCRLLQSI